jgi:hypothetical protein
VTVEALEGLDVKEVVTESIRDWTTKSDRSQQSDQGLLGPSEIGACRAYIAHTIAGTERLPEEGIKLAAFVGEAVGELTERAVIAHLAKTIGPAAQQQVPLTARLPGLGVEISGHADLVVGPSVWDCKTKNSLADTRRNGADFKHIAQINTYQLARIQQGLATPEDKWSLIYIDRSGEDENILVISSPYDPDITAQVEARLEDAMYAAQYDLSSAPRDEPYPFCARYCSFFNACRGGDEHQQGGLITDPALLDAEAQYREGRDMVREGEKLKEAAQKKLDGVYGSTGKHSVTWTEVPETFINGYTRKSYTRIDVRPVRAPKKAT